MKNTIIKTDETRRNFFQRVEMKKGNFFIKREIFLAITFFLLALLLFSALSTMAQTSETFFASDAMLLESDEDVQSSPEGDSVRTEIFNVTRYGKKVALTKDNWVSIVEFTVVSESSATRLNWKMKNSYGKGMCAVMRSEDGINYSYVSLLPAAKRENSFVVQNDGGSNPSYYRVLYINERNTFCLSEIKNSSDFLKETITQQ